MTTKEAKAIVAVFAERPKLLRVMRLVIDAIEKEKKKRRKGRRGLLEVGDGAGDVEAACLSYGAPVPKLPPAAPSRRCSARLLRPWCPCPAIAHLRPVPTSAEL